MNYSKSTMLAIYNPPVFPPSIPATPHREKYKSGLGIAPLVAGAAAKVSAETVVAIVSSAITIFSAIAAKNQAIKDGIVTEKLKIKESISQINSLINELRLTRDGLDEERTMLLGDRARRGMGLFKSRQIKKEQIKLQYNETELKRLMEQANSLSTEIQILGEEVLSLRRELGIREDAPLTLQEARVGEAGNSTKQVFILLGIAAALVITMAIVKGNKKKK